MIRTGVSTSPPFRVVWYFKEYPNYPFNILYHKRSKREMKRSSSIKNFKVNCDTYLPIVIVENRPWHMSHSHPFWAGEWGISSFLIQILSIAPLSQDLTPLAASLISKAILDLLMMNKDIFLLYIDLIKIKSIFPIHKYIWKANTSKQSKLHKNIGLCSYLNLFQKNIVMLRNSKKLLFNISWNKKKLIKSEADIVQIFKKTGDNCFWVI